jgi:hypothetical protein
MKTGEAVGDYLGCRFRRGFGSLLIGELFSGSGLSLGSGCSNSKIVLGRDGQVWLGGGDDEDLFELIEVRGGPKLNQRVGLVIGIRLNRLNGSNREAAGIDLVAARGENLLPDLDT